MCVGTLDQLWLDLTIHFSLRHKPPPSMEERKRERGVVGGGGKKGRGEKEKDTSWRQQDPLTLKVTTFEYKKHEKERSVSLLNDWRDLQRKETTTQSRRESHRERTKNGGEKGGGTLGHRRTYCALKDYPFYKFWTFWVTGTIWPSTSSRVELVYDVDDRRSFFGVT